MPFEPVGVAEKIIDILRLSEITWLADQLVQAIQEGKSISRKEESLNSMVNQYDETIDYSENEQLEMVLKAIEQYSIVLHKVWIQINKEINSIENNFQIKIFPVTGTEALLLFREDITELIPRIERLLSRIRQNDI